MDVSKILNESIFEERIVKQENKIWSEPIEILDPSVRAYNCLKRANINTIGELLLYDLERLSKIRNMGKKSLDEIVNKLKNIGLHLKGMDEQEEIVKPVIRKTGFIYNESIEILELSVRAMNCLKRARIETIDDLLTYDIISLSKIKNMGRQTVNEIVSKLKTLSLSLNGSE